jgi:very-short-patch-repair endonuclease
MKNTTSNKKLEKMADELLGKRKPRRRRKKPSSIPSSWATRNRNKLLAKKNKAEEHIEKCLTYAGILFTRESPVRCNGKEYFMDFAVETSVGIVAIEVDGSQHMNARGQAKDRIRDRNILRSGEAISIIRLSWSQALKMDRSITQLISWSSEWSGNVVLRY